MTIILDWLKWIEMESFIKTIFMYFLGFLFLTVIEKSFREDRNVYKCIIFNKCFELAVCTNGFLKF